MKDNVLESIYSSVLKFLVPLAPKETFATIVEEAVKLVKGDNGILYLGIDGELVQEYASGIQIKHQKSDKQQPAYLSYIQKKAFILDYRSNKTSKTKLINGYKSSLFIPLSYKNKSFGVLTIQSLRKGKVFTDEDLNTLKLFGSLASLAIRKMQLYNETTKALEMRDKFISLAAHELRTPLTSIHGYLQLLTKKMGVNKSTEAKWIADMYGESLKLTNLINELLEVNRIETGKQLYNFFECDLMAIIIKAIERLKITYPYHSVVYDSNEFENKSASIVIADEDKLYQVVLSLLDNAAKFSEQNYPISVRLYSKNFFYVFEIEDKGRGIAKKELPRIFEGFYKGSNNQVVGMGLGLLLARNIIQKHHGTIVVTSKINKGTKVRVKLPQIKNKTF